MSDSADNSSQGTKGRSELLITCLLAEYSALKQEQNSRITLRETSLYMSIVITMGVFTAYFSETGSAIPIPLIIPLASTILFFIYAFNDEMVSRIRSYILESLSVRLNEPNAPIQLFSWETHHRSTSFAHYVRKISRVLVVWVTFSGFSILSLMLTFDHAPSLPKLIQLDLDLYAHIWMLSSVLLLAPYALTKTLLDL